MSFQIPSDYGSIVWERAANGAYAMSLTKCISKKNYPKLGVNTTLISQF